VREDSPAWAHAPWWAVAVIFGPVHRSSGHPDLESSPPSGIDHQPAAVVWTNPPGPKQTVNVVQLVITDLNMPVRGGEQLIDDLAQAHPNLPVVVVSGYSSSENADLPPEVLFVPKPFSTKMLLACVRQALDDC
jgi:CheY-like chemotaxis protein